MKKPFDWVAESKRFDEAADYYDIYRPSYPAELIDQIISLVPLEANTKILEIGAGSGKATELFVERGYRLVCIEPGANLAAAGQQKFLETGQVEFVVSRFENWDETPEQFDLAFSAQAFHWVPKPIGFEKCAKALKAERYLALFWNLYMRNSDPLDRELSAICAEYGVCIFLTEEGVEQRIQGIAREIIESGWFTEPTTYRYPWSRTYTLEEFMGFLQTGNGYIGLAPTERQELIEKLSAVFAKNGGSILRSFVCALFLTQRLAG